MQDRTRHAPSRRPPRHRFGSRSPIDVRAFAQAREPEEADSARRRLECNGIVVRHGYVKGGTIHVLRLRGTIDSAVVLRTAIGRAQDQRLSEPVAQGLQLVQRRRVDQQLVSASAGNLGGRGVRPSPLTLATHRPPTKMLLTVDLH